MPLLSIVMPSYNYAQYIRQAIDSILSQDFEDFELIIIEDASTDQSPAIIQEYADQDRRIKPIFHKQNRGVLPRCNEGVQLAKGKYLHFIAADDYRYPGFLRKTLKPLLQHPEVGICYAQFHWGNEKEHTLETLGFEKQKELLIFDPAEMADIFLLKNFKIFTVAAIMEKQLVIENGSFDADLYYLSDWYLLNQITFQKKTAIVTEPLSRFRIHDANYSNVYRHNKKTKMAAYKCLLSKLYEKNNKYFRDQIRKSGQMTFLFQDLFWKLLFNPKYLNFWPYVNQKYPIKERIKKSFKKKLGFR